MGVYVSQDNVYKGRMSNVVIQGFPSSGAFTQADIRGYKSYAASIIYEEDTWVVKELQNDLGFPMIWDLIIDGQFQVSLNNYTPVIDLLGIADKILCFGNPGYPPEDSYRVIPNYSKEENIFLIIGLDKEDKLSNLAFADFGNFFHASIEIRIYP